MHTSLVYRQLTPAWMRIDRIHRRCIPLDKEWVNSSNSILVPTILRTSLANIQGEIQESRLAKGRRSAKAVY